MTNLQRITLFPIKALDGVDVPAASILPSGALEGDRRFALVDAEQRFVNGKRTSAIHLVRSKYDADLQRVTLTSAGAEIGPHSLTREPTDLESWLSERLEIECSLIENRESGLPDDTDSPGPTLISTQSLEAIAEWFELTLDECRRRFRTNLEINAPHAFWEDALVGKQFSLGGVVFHGVNVCQRCVVPSRDSQTGEPTAGFQKRFAELRESSLPEASRRSAFNHFYRVAINTRLVGSPGEISLGDPLQL